MAIFKITPKRNQQAGFSIMEVMVALFISLIMLAAVITVFVNTRQSFQFQQGINSLNDNIRFAVRTMSHDLRMAGHWAGASSGLVFSDIDEALASAALRFCIGYSPHLAAVVADDQPMRGISIASAATLPSTPPVASAASCINPAFLVDETDVLTVNYVKPEVKPDNSPEINGFQLFQRTRVGVAPRMFMNVATIGSKYPTGSPLGDDAVNLPFVSSSYAVSRCTSLIANVPGGPCLGKRRLLRASTNGSGGNLYSYDLVSDGVEAMSFLMMVDSERDGTDVRFLNADDLLADNTLGANPFDAVVAVNISMVVSSDRVAIGVPNNTTYDMPGTDYTPVAAESAYPRRLVTSTVQLRNNN